MQKSLDPHLIYYMYHASGYLFFFFWHVNYCCEFCKNERYSINFSICISHFKQLVLIKPKYYRNVLFLQYRNYHANSKIGSRYIWYSHYPPNNTYLKPFFLQQLHHLAIYLCWTDLKQLINFNATEHIYCLDNLLQIPVS